MLIFTLQTFKNCRLLVGILIPDLESNYLDVSPLCGAELRPRDSQKPAYRGFVRPCRAFLKCSTGLWMDTAATVQPNW